MDIDLMTFEKILTQLNKKTSDNFHLYDNN